MSMGSQDPLCMQVRVTFTRACCVQGCLAGLPFLNSPALPASIVSLRNLAWLVVSCSFPHGPLQGPGVSPWGAVSVMSKEPCRYAETSPDEPEPKPLHPA